MFSKKFHRFVQRKIIVCSFTGVIHLIRRRKERVLWTISYCSVFPHTTIVCERTRLESKWRVLLHWLTDDEWSWQDRRSTSSVCGDLSLVSRSNDYPVTTSRWHIKYVYLCDCNLSFMLFKSSKRTGRLVQGLYCSLYGKRGFEMKNVSRPNLFWWKY